MSTAKKITLLLLACLVYNTGIATTLIPFPNLGEMAKASHSIVFVQAEQNFELTTGQTTRFYTRLRVIKSIKGSFRPGQVFNLKNLHKRIGEYESIVWGDLEMQEGKNYLLLLSKNEFGDWLPMMLSFGAFEEHIRNNQSVLVPIELGTEVTIRRSANGQIAEPFAVYETDKLLAQLSGVIKGKKHWDKEGITAPYSVQSFRAASRAAPPGHCTYLSSPPYPRWDNFPTALPVYYAAAGDSGCSTAVNKIQGAIGTMNGSYGGINLTDGGSHGYIPTCSGGEGATDDEFTTWVSTNLGGSRHLLIQFDDPCSEIPDLTGCSGILAFGGLYFFSSTHMWDGMNWRNAGYGYVVVNNGTGACQCPSTDYDVMITHELTHSLGIGHVEASNGTANMNPSCCNFIQPLDIQCLDYTYLNPLPVELISFDGQQEQKTITLNWQTASEFNNDLFVLEKADANGNFKEIGWINGSGTSLLTQEYTFVDHTPLPGENLYRLSQVDFDGNITVGNTINVDFYSGIELSLFPNPMTGNLLQVTLSTEFAGKFDFDIYNVVGKKVYDRKLNLNRGETNQTLSLENLPAGTYILRIRQNQKVITQRFIKKD